MGPRLKSVRQISSPWLVKKRPSWLPSMKPQLFKQGPNSLASICLSPNSLPLSTTYLKSGHNELLAMYYQIMEPPLCSHGNSNHPTIQHSPSHYFDPTTFFINFHCHLHYIMIFSITQISQLEYKDQEYKQCLIELGIPNI